MRKLFFLFFALIAGGLFAGTLIMKDGTKLTNVTVISISKGRVVIEKDKTKKTIGLGKIAEYYHADIKGINDTGDLGEYAQYEINFNVKMPDKGVDRKGKATSCEISYNIHRIGENKSAKLVKAPYFYVYILTSGSGEYGKRKIFRFYHPKDAKPKGKGYDKAAVMEKVNSFKRPNINYNYNYSNRKVVKKNLSRQPGSRVIEIPLKELKNRKILAYHIEAWGHDSMIREKDWREHGIKAKRWWERY